MRGELAEGERNPGVVGLRDHLAQRGDLRFIGQMLHGVGGEWAGRVLFSRREQQLHDPHGIVARVALSGRRRGAQGRSGGTELR